jgi:hypothetical protein
MFAKRNSRQINNILDTGPDTENTDHGPDMGFYGTLVNQSEKRILKSHIIIIYIKLNNQFQMLVVPNNMTARKVPNVEGMMVYQKDNNKLYVQGDGKLKALAEEKVRILAYLLNLWRAFVAFLSVFLWRLWFNLSILIVSIFNLSINCQVFIPDFLQLSIVLFALYRS